MWSLSFMMVVEVTNNVVCRARPGCTIVLHLDYGRECLLFTCIVADMQGLLMLMIFKVPNIGQHRWQTGQENGEFKRPWGTF